MSRKTLALFDPTLVKPAIVDSFKKLDPRLQWRNPVMFVVYVGSILTTVLWAQALGGQGEAPAGFILAIALWLWFTVLFANFAEALAEGRSKAQAASLRGAKKTVMAKKLREPRYGAPLDLLPGTELRRGDVVLIEAGDMIPADGEVIEGVASVNESAITGESAPVIRESGGDFSAVTGGTTVLSDWIVVRVSVNPGEAFIDRMIAMVEGAKRQKTPNEIALTILLVALTIIFLGVTVTLLPFSLFSVNAAKAGSPVTITVLVALLVCLIPTTIAGLLSAIGVAGMSRMMQANVIATSGRAVEAAGDVDVLLLDKTGTITLGNRQATDFLPASGVTEAELADAAQLASLADETPEGRSIVVLAKQRFNLRERDIHALGATFIHFSAQTRMSGVDLDGRQIRKGSADAIRRHVETQNGYFPAEVVTSIDHVARRGSTPLVVADGSKVLGVIELKDIVKGGIKERFAELRRMGIKTVMITGDNRLTAAAIAAEAGVDDFLAEATPEAKLALIRQHQAEGRLVAMTGDGTNDAPALAQADVAVAMNYRHHGRQGSRQHGGSGFQSDQVDRDCRDRQANVDDARLADDVQRRQRYRQIFRHRAGGFRHHLPATHGTQRDGSFQSGFGDSVGGDFQCPDHHLSHPAGVERRPLSTARRGGPVAAQPADLRLGRRDRPVRRHQIDRCLDYARRLGVKSCRSLVP